MADKTDKNPRTLLIAAAAVVAIVIIIAAGFVLLNGGSAPSNAQDATVKASVNKDCTITPWVVGEQKGFFNTSGSKFIDVGEISSANRNAALIGGQVNVLDIDPQNLIDLLKAGAPVTAVAQSGDDPADGDMDKEHMQWLVLNGSPLHSASDIPKFVGDNGRKVKIGVVALGICADLQNNAWLRTNNISKDDIEYVIIADPNQEQALSQGLIDIAILHPPFYYAAEQHGGYRILAYSSETMGGSGGTTLLVFQNSFIKEHPDAVRNFIKAYKKAEAWSNSNRQEASGLTAKAIGLDSADVHWYSRSGAINDTQLQTWIDNLAADGVIKQGEYKPGDLYTTEFKDAW